MMKKLAWVLVVLPVMVACVDLNEDLQNCTGLAGNSVTVTVKFKGATGPLTTFVNSFNTPPKDAVQTAPDEWKFTWDLSSSPIAPAFKYHVGATLKGGAKIDSWSYKYSNTYPPGPSPPVVQMAPASLDVVGLAMSVEQDNALGYVLRLSNGSSGPITLQSLRWATSVSHFPLAQLLPGDPGVEALSWVNAPITVPQLISPGTVDVDIPDASMLAANFVLVRAIVGESGSCAPEGIYESSTYDAVSAVGPTPQGVSLYQNYPNPFNPHTTVTFSLVSESDVAITIYDAQGRFVRELVRDHRSAGSYTVEWNGTDFEGALVASGVYFYRLMAGSFTDSKKMIMLK